jgi:two-component system, NarL family, sensor kinase
LVAALEDLAATQAARGVPTSVSSDPALTVTDGSAQLLYRCVQEALRNTVKHAGPCRASIELSRVGSDVVAHIRDDGSGFDPTAAAARRRDGHIGLGALTDLVRDPGGRLEVSTSPGRGTVVAVSLPG